MVKEVKQKEGKVGRSFNTHVWSKLGPCDRLKTFKSICEQEVCIGDTVSEVENLRASLRGEASMQRGVVPARAPSEERTFW